MNFRWLPYAKADAAWNMAVDEAILEAHLQGISPTTIRFYGWAPPAVSLGYAQKIDQTAMQKIRQHGFTIVRRPTGGRAVLHQGDLTYSFIGSSIGSSNEKSQSTSSLLEISNRTFNVPETENFESVYPLSPGVSSSYLQICAGLISGLEILGVHAEIGRGKGAYNRFQDCFQATTNADLQVDGLKIIGSAQLRRKNAVLQHGSILLNQEQRLMPEILNLKTSPQPDFKRHCNLFDIVDDQPIEHIEKAFIEGFFNVTKIRPEPGVLTAFETELALILKSKYAIQE